MNEFVNSFKALSDNTRLRIMCLLSKANGELCVCEIMDCLEKSQYNVSRHLRILRGAGLLAERKEGRWAFYSLARPQNQFRELIQQALLAVAEEVSSLDSERLRKRLSLRENGKCVVGINSQEWRKISNG